MGTGMFQRQLYIPRPDYGSRLALWDKEFRLNKVIVSSEIDLSVLAKISDGYTASDIAFAVSKVMTPMRKKQQAFKPVRNAEFVPFLAEREPVFLEEERATWSGSTRRPWGRSASMLCMVQKFLRMKAVGRRRKAARRRRRSDSCNTRS